MPKKMFFDKITAFGNEPFFSCLLLNKDFACAYTEKSTCTRAFTEGL